MPKQAKERSSIRVKDKKSTKSYTHKEKQINLEIDYNSLNSLKCFLLSAPNNSVSQHNMLRFPLDNGEYISCIFYNSLYLITGTDIIRCLAYRFKLYGRTILNNKKFEEGVFSDLRNLKPNLDSILEEPRSEFLEFLYRSNCVRTQKKQKIFFWFSVPHDKLFLDALNRDLKRETLGLMATTKISNNVKVEEDKDNEEHPNERYKHFLIGDLASNVNIINKEEQLVQSPEPYNQQSIDLETMDLLSHNNEDQNNNTHYHQLLDHKESTYNNTNHQLENINNNIINHNEKTLLYNNPHNINYNNQERNLTFMNYKSNDTSYYSQNYTPQLDDNNSTLFNTNEINQFTPKDNEMEFNYLHNNNNNNNNNNGYQYYQFHDTAQDKYIYNIPYYYPNLNPSSNNIHLNQGGSNLQSNEEWIGLGLNPI